MSPPIRDGSGNDIGAIRLGDGSEISEVRTGAGDVLFSGGAIPDSVTQRPNDNNSFDDDFSDGLVINFDDNYQKFAVRISSNTSGFSRIRVHDYSANGNGEYVYVDDISSKIAGDTVVIEQEVVPDTDYGVEIDDNGSVFIVGFNDSASNYPYSGENIDIVGQSRDGEIRVSEKVRAINDIGNPEDVL